MADDELAYLSIFVKGAPGETNRRGARRSEAREAEKQASATR